MKEIRITFQKVYSQLKAMALP